MRGGKSYSTALSDLTIRPPRRPVINGRHATIQVKRRTQIKPAESRAALRVRSREGFPNNPSRTRGSKVNRTTKCLSERERENFNHALFAFAVFSRRRDRELLGAISRGLLECPRRV
jgi:hypothetical protein